MCKEGDAADVRFRAQDGDRVDGTLAVELLVVDTVNAQRARDKGTVRDRHRDIRERAQRERKVRLRILILRIIKDIAVDANLFQEEPWIDVQATEMHPVGLPDLFRSRRTK